MSVLHFDYLDSTNEYLKVKYRFLDDFTVVYVDEQLKGKGREKREWDSEPKKNLLCSILIKNKNVLSYLDCLSLLTGVVAFKTLKKLKIKELSIKWPNDLYVKDKKIAGILVESVSLSSNIAAAIIGVGINLNQEQFNTGFDATSYKLETNKNVRIDKVLNIFIKLLRKELWKLTKNKSKYISVINENNYLLNKTAFAVINNKKVEVKVLNINPDNTLNIVINGENKSIRSNEISFH